jgi:hypothetical protein
LSYSTRKQTSDKQEVVIENVGETLTNQGPIRNKDDDLKKNRRMYLFIVHAFKNVYNLIDICLFDCFVENFNSFSVGAFL